MGLKSLITDAVDAGFSALGSSGEDGIQTSITYTTIATGDYDPDTGRIDTIGTSSVFDCIFYKVRDREVDGIKIKINDIRVIFPQNRISNTPSASDFIMLKGSKMEITEVREDPASATWILFVRGV